MDPVLMPNMRSLSLTAQKNLAKFFLPQSYKQTGQKLNALNSIPAIKANFSCQKIKQSQIHSSNLLFKVNHVKTINHHLSDSTSLVFLFLNIRPRELLLGVSFLFAFLLLPLVAFFVFSFFFCSFFFGLFLYFQWNTSVNVQVFCNLFLYFRKYFKHHWALQMYN